ncbi:MAG: hypothetical protein Q9195_004519 [Heterodermia aff. obscurata]
MGELYSKAEKVLAWLGEEDSDARIARRFTDFFIPELQALMRREGRNDYSSYDLRDQDRWYSRIAEEPIPKEGWQALAAFFERTWFTCTWTFQEVVLANEAVMYCGSTRIDYNRFRDLLDYLDLSDYESNSIVKDSEEMTAGREIYQMMWHLRLIIDGDREEGEMSNNTPASYAEAFREQLLKYRALCIITDMLKDSPKKYKAKKLLSLGRSSSAHLPALRELTAKLVRVDEFPELAENHLTKEPDGLAHTRKLTHAYNFRCLMTTKKNFIGVVPIETQEGDHIFVLPGARVPMILRSVEEGTYELLEDAYIHGIMHGEAYNYIPKTMQEISIV